jgi:hypothetical protein
VHKIKIKRLAQRGIKGEGRGSPEFIDVACSTGDASSSGSGSLVAERSRERARVPEGVEALL